MLHQILTFQDLVAPLDRRVFLRDYYRKRHLHLPGGARRFDAVFGWDALNRLLASPTLWDYPALHLARNGEAIPQDVYCYRGKSRDRTPVNRPDIPKVRALLSHNASMVLGFAEYLTPEFSSITRTLETVLGGETTAAVFHSYRDVQGYPVHYDIQNVFALQFAGEKVWRIYENRYPNAAAVKGADPSDRPQGEHGQRKGALLDEVLLTPGDVLYLPHGQYHEALSVTDASLHVSFGVIHDVVTYFLTQLIEDLAQDPFYREHLPHFDDVDGQQQFLHAAGARLKGFFDSPEMADQFRDYLKTKAFERDWQFQLPDTRSPKRYRVCWNRGRFRETGVGTVFDIDNRSVSLQRPAAPILSWLQHRDYFLADELTKLGHDLPASAVEDALSVLETGGVIQSMGA